MTTITRKVTTTLLAECPSGARGSIGALLVLQGLAAAMRVLLLIYITISSSYSSTGCGFENEAVDIGSRTEKVAAASTSKPMDPSTALKKLGNVSKTLLNKTCKDDQFWLGRDPLKNVVSGRKNKFDKAKEMFNLV